MHRLLLAVLAACFLFATPVDAQSRAQLKRELKKMERAAGDTDALMATADWAKEKGLATDYKRLLNRVLKREPDHEGAMAGLGFVRYKGEWKLKSKVDLLIKQEQEAAYIAQGLEQVDGVWVSSAEVEDAKVGVFHHDGDVVSRDEKLALLEGKVRHPMTGQFIAKEDLAKANQGMFPISEGRWVDQEAADEYHSDFSHPWVVRSYHATIVTTAPLAQTGEMKQVADSSIELVRPFFGSKVSHPAHRPVVIACSTTDEYRQVGNAIGSETSVYGAFVAERTPPDLGSFVFEDPPGVANWGEKSWGPYYVRHAAAAVYAQSVAAESKAELPLWLLVGVGSLAERHFTPGVSAHFGNQHLSKGGVQDVEDWFASFEVSADVPDRVEYNIYQAGLAVAFSMRGGDAESTRAAQAFTASLGQGGSGVEKAAQDLEMVLTGKEQELRAYLKDVIAKARVNR